ncbi:hypothetical protein F4809DRAFT_315070 [Biscogniauxia mediterranea]|nr:hypothetical protein F4809DRAFT_315070 [Biscogniauxia mediterranea]
MKSVLSISLTLAGLVLAQAASAPPSIYVLMPNQASTSAVADALSTLGYSRTEDAPLYFGDHATRSDPNTYTVLSAGNEYMNISQLNPEAKFILPVGRGSFRVQQQPWPLKTMFRDGRPAVAAAASDEYAESVRDFFSSRAEASRQLLELDVHAPKSAMQAQTWVTLCDFLGLGYSVVERLKLWRFP